MWTLNRLIIIYFQIISLVSCENEGCSDPNAELRFDSADCVLTCNKRSIFENPESCFQKHNLQEDCYCKQGYYLEEKTTQCVQFQNCPCNNTNDEKSRFSNECGNNQVTFHTLTPCPNLLRSQCWCDALATKDAIGNCVSKE